MGELRVKMTRLPNPSSMGAALFAIAFVRAAQKPALLPGTITRSGGKNFPSVSGSGTSALPKSGHFASK